MELVIVADLEGMSGVAERAWCDPARLEYARALDQYAEDVRAVSQAARAFGIAPIRLLDWHGRTIPPSLCTSDIEPALLPLDRNPRVAVLLGFHARGDAPRAFAPCTLLPGLSIEWDGRPAGELALASRWLGEQGIPLLLVSGDRALTAEAELWTDQTTAIAVKLAHSPDRAECLPPDRARAALVDALQRVLARRSWWWVYRPSSPIDVTVSLPAGGQERLVASSMNELFVQLDTLVARAGGIPTLARLASS
jgi:D-amino peptidase